MKLELKHLAGYLPYSLKIYWEDSQNRPQEAWELKCNAVDFVLNNQNKPILRPLSDLTKEIEVNDEKFVSVEWFEIGDDSNDSVEYEYGNIKLIKSLESISKNGDIHDILFLQYGVVEKLLEWHFDIYGLIEKGLAIDINTI